MAGIDVLQRVFPAMLEDMTGHHDHNGNRNSAPDERDRHEHDPHQHQHEHGHQHAHEHGHQHEHYEHEQHEHAAGPAPGRLRHLLRPHSHEAAATVDAALESSAEGLRTLRRSLIALGATACAQGMIVALTGSVALLGDTVHNAADALTAVPLGIAFLLGRRQPNRHYTYGYGRAEDLAGVAVVVIIAASSVAAGYQAIGRLAHPRPVTHLAAVAGAALLGFAGNELVARYRVRTGRRIGSAALVADGMHARTDAYASLAVLFGAGGAALGWRWADPVVGLAILVPIAVTGWHAAREVGRRLMDSVDPKLTDLATSTLCSVPGVLGVGCVRLRWTGHRLRAECDIQVDPASTAVAAHDVSAAAEHALLHAIPRLAAATVHADPYAPDGADYHAALTAHRAA